MISCKFIAVIGILGVVKEVERHIFQVVAYITVVLQVMKCAIYLAPSMGVVLIHVLICRPYLNSSLLQITVGI
jgi:hypothetical protein